MNTEAIGQVERAGTAMGYIQARWSIPFVPHSIITLHDVEGKIEFKPPATLEFTESTEEKSKIMRHCGSVLSVISNDQREWVVKKEEPSTMWEKALDQSTHTDNLKATSRRSWSTPFTRQ
jgi:hypothetical protein